MSVKQFLGVILFASGLVWKLTGNTSGQCVSG